ncbi:MAG: hypothetical protein RLZZ426_242 [Actinomycetota bacterium]
MRNRSVLTIGVVLWSLIFTTSTASAAPVNFGHHSSVVISEISCSNSIGDFIELVNLDSLHPVSIAGWLLSDQSLDKEFKAHRFVFPSGTVINAGGRIVVSTNTKYVLPFGIGCADDSIRLARPAQSGFALNEQVAVPNLLEEFTWARFISLPKIWQAAMPTKGSANIRVASGTVVDRAAFLYDPMLEHQIEIQLTDANWAALATQTQQNHRTYLPATFRLVNSAGTPLPASGPMNIGIRLKGNVGSFRSFGLGSKAGFKIKFDAFVPDQRFFGLKKITLNNMVQDPTMTNQVVSYQMFRDLGIKACRTGFANVTINGNYFGFYLNVEQYDDVSLAWDYPMVTHLFEGTHAGPWPSAPDLLNLGYEYKFPVDEGDEDDISDIANLVMDLQDIQSKVNDLLGEGKHENIAPASIDIQQIAVMMAVEKYMSHWDGYSGTPEWTPNNHFLLNPNGGGFQILPWGVDQTFTGWVEPLGVSGATLFKVCLVDTRCRAIFYSTLADLPRVVTQKNYGALFNQLFAAHQTSRRADVYQGVNEGTRLGEIQYKPVYISQRANAIREFVLGELTPVIFWTPKTSIIRLGSPLSVQHLNAFGSVAGNISYSLGLGSRPALGSIAITATLTPFDNSIEQIEKTITFRVKEIQTLIVPVLAAKRLAKSAASNKFTIKATSTSKLAVVAKSLSPAVCAATKLTIQMKKKGACKIQFSQAGNSKYDLAATITKSFIIK